MFGETKLLTVKYCVNCGKAVAVRVDPSMQSASGRASWSSTPSSTEMKRPYLTSAERELFIPEAEGGGTSTTVGMRSAGCLTLRGFSKGGCKRQTTRYLTAQPHPARLCST